ncbi:undecaprenyldiphospho-muramoylpentapeptide beta-N-acetylglucosaminyltransferase [Alicyclobacillus sp. SO9]|uniref:undecaprenyldiphospho-muramoylpentapeptide beta-N-acetylglucosaminyltransferase n=1 Tax=Alicyclobacillus sp. SO9 TaxID=2665646 RepID=UPI0018E839EC|nr:undecaprenyldiphospho-muramoylpentapeptide beta-N-acetylglucosaminyltransferase [Alicyclobacillus sp. SO9]QQE80704.1 undecaprenyldiphospho-muramoylpentapeptide beta-N-acetylglucosaminyltransferase [Alicyclobacillus sp. SO9]
MRFLLTGGGTGGHIYPALTLWHTIETRMPDAEVLYVGTERGLEHGIVPRAGLPFQTIFAAGLRRQVSLQAVKTVWTTYRGYRQAKRLLKKFKPDVVVGTGGYVTLPVVYAAARLGIPSVVWEANARPGLTNVLCSRKSSAVAVCFEDSGRYFPKAKKVVLTGNPRGSEVLHYDRKDLLSAQEAYGLDASKKLILCYGGSRGAETVNQVLVDLIPRFHSKQDWQLLYITGEAHYESVQRQLSAPLPANVAVVPFAYDMPHLLPQAAVVVTRAGGATLAEVCSLGLAAILIPSPYVTANHQEENARRLAQAGAAKMIVENELTPDKLWSELTKVLDSPEGDSLRRAALSKAAPDAVEKLYEVVMAAVTR